MLKKGIFFSVAVLLFLTAFTGCAASAAKTEKIDNTAKKDTKITIVTTLFPQYDFVRRIAGDKASVTMLLPPGTESHSFEPTPADIIKINNARLFIYTGAYMEPWAASIIEGIASDKVTVLDCSKNVSLVKTEDIEREHGDHDESEAAEEHDHEYDPHFWTDPTLAQVMVDNISEALCQIDAVNAEYYKANAAAYKGELDKLDTTFKEIVAGGARKDMIFGGRFAFYYFTERYGLSYEAAYDSCSTEAEPSARKVAELINEIKEKKMPVIFYEELVDPKVAKSISEQTGAKILLMHSCHNLSKSDFEGGATYLSLMKQNAENLREGLK